MSRRTSIPFWLLAILVVVCSLLFIPPWIPHFSLEGIPHADYGLVLNLAFDQGWQFGSEIVYTFGPYGFLYVDVFDPNTHVLNVTVWCFLAFTVAVAVVTMLDIERPLLSLCAVALFFFGLNTYSDNIFFVIPLLFLLIFFHPRALVRRWLTIPLLAACALVGLVKLTFAILSFSVIVLVEGYRLSERRYFPSILLWYIAFSILFFSLARQDLGNIDEYFQASLAMVTGYTEAMQSFGPRREIVAFFLVGASFLVLSAFAEWRLRKWREGTVLILVISLFCFLTFKAGFVRHDIHAQLAWGCLACGIALVYLARVSHSSFGVSPRVWSFSLGLLAVVSSGYWRIPDDDVHKNFVIELPERAGALTNFLFNRSQFREDLAQMTEERRMALAKIRSDTGPLPPLEGSVDIYPWGAALLFAHEINYRPRPVFQSYSVYNEKLIQLNRDHLQGEHAPSTLLFRPHSIDQRYPSLDDAQSWLDILSRYDPTGNDYAGHSLWKKRSVPREVAVSESSVVSLVTGFSESFSLPADWDLVWVSIEFEKTLLGQISSILFKPPTIQAYLTMVDGVKLNKRLVPAIARGGFLVSPLIDSGGEFPQLIAERDSLLSPQNRVATIHIAASGFGRASTWFYHNKIRLSFRKLLIEEV